MGSKRKSKKSKKSKSKKSKVDESDLSEDEEKSLKHEIRPIGHYINDRKEMINQMFSTLKGKALKAILPPILKDIPLEELKNLCLEELLGMSSKRIISILEGQELESSSDTEESDEEVKASEASAPENPKTKEEEKVDIFELIELEMRARMIRSLLAQEGDLEEPPLDEQGEGNTSSTKDKE